MKWVKASYFRDPFWDPFQKCVEICIIMKDRNPRDWRALLVYNKLERTRGAGAPEVLRRETAEEEFAFGEISL